MPENPLKTVILTLGNELRGDDYAGILFGNLVRDRTESHVIEGGDAPENVTGIVAAIAPEHILIVDAMDLSGRPGDRIVVDGADISADAASTHGTSRLLAEYLLNRTGATVQFLGFQPLNHGIGEGMSPAVEESVRQAAELYISAEAGVDVLALIDSSGRREHDSET